MKTIINWINSFFKKEDDKVLVQINKIKELINKDEKPDHFENFIYFIENKNNNHLITVSEDIQFKPNEISAGCPANYEAINTQRVIKKMIDDMLDNQFRIEKCLKDGKLLSPANRTYLTECLGWRIKEYKDRLVGDFELTYKKKFYNLETLD